MQLELELGLTQQVLKMNKVRGFEVVSKYVDHILMHPVRATKGSAGYDIYNNTGSEIVLAPGELSKAITTKFKSYMLEDEVLMIYPRSGHGFKYSVRLANTVGVIDQSYYKEFPIEIDGKIHEGEIMIKLHNQGNDVLRIPVGEAFAQGIFTKYLLIDGDSYDAGVERVGGLGSTTGSK